MPKYGIRPSFFVEYENDAPAVARRPKPRAPHGPRLTGLGRAVTPPPTGEVLRGNPHPKRRGY